MSAFSDQFLRDDANAGGWLRRLTGGGAKEPRVFLGAFGKHPGWDDHLDDIGLQTGSLTLAKQLLYVEGIGGQINAGAWDRLPEEKRLPVFWHVFLWRRKGRALAGRLWSSTDGKGRGHYPMVLCSEIDYLPLDWTLERVLPQLEAAETACRATDSAEDVRAILETGRQALAQEAAGLTAVDAGERGLAAAWPHEWSDAGAEEAALRVLYCVRSQWGDYAPGRSAEGRPRELRLSCQPGVNPAQTLRAWVAAFDALLDPAAPVLFMLPLAGDWLDVIVGEPVSESFFALRAAPATLPPADLVPYTLDAAWRAQAGAFLAGLPDEQGGNLQSAKKFWRSSTG